MVSEDCLLFNLETNPNEPIRMQVLAQSIRIRFPDWVLDVVCGVDSLLLHTDLCSTAPVHELESIVDGLLDVMAREKDVDPTKAAPGPVIEIPACYDASMGLDQARLCQQLGLTCEELISLHSGRVYEVQALGFAPGFAYMTTVDEKLQFSRRSSPRTRVPQGSIGIADQYTGIYPFQSPGGWNLIARTPTRVFDIEREAPSLFEVGSRVRFVPISLEQYASIVSQSQGGMQ